MSRRVAILIGSEKFASGSGLDNLGGPRNDVEALQKVLGDPARGDFEVTTLLDQTRGVVMPTLDETLGSRPSGVGFKLPQAATVKSRGGERCGKGGT
jgi:hypothetical protein